jgi:quinol monooxygenase YgiN
VTEHAHVVRIGRFPPADGHQADVVRLVGALAEAARSAKGCFGAQVMKSDRDDAVVLISRWESGDALTRWTDSTAFLSIRAQLDRNLMRFPAFEHFTSI